MNNHILGRTIFMFVLSIIFIIEFFANWVGSTSASEAQCLVCKVRCLEPTSHNSYPVEKLLPDQFRHVELASQSHLPKAVISMSKESGDLLFGELCQQSSIWCEISLKKPDGSRWAVGAINQISISPDGRTIFAVEESGRFAVIRVQESSCIDAYSYQLPYYLRMDISIESKNKQDINRLIQSPRSIRVLTTPNHDYVAMRGIEIESFVWLEQNRFIAISYDDGRIIKFDTKKKRVDSILRNSQWKWSQSTGSIELYHTDKEKPIHNANIFLAEMGKIEFVRPIGLFADEYFVFQDYSRACSIINLKSGKVINQPLQVGFAIPISKYQFAIISRENNKSRCQWIDVRSTVSSIEFDVEGLFDREKYVGFPLFDDCYISNEGIIQLLVSDSPSSGGRYLSAAIKRSLKTQLPKLSKHDKKRIDDKDIKGATFGPDGKSIRYCKYPDIVELDLLK